MCSHQVLDNTVSSSLDILRRIPWMTGARRANKRIPNLSWLYSSVLAETRISEETMVATQVYVG